MMGCTLSFVADSINGREKNLIWHGIRIVHDGHTGELRYHLFQHLEIFPCDARVQDREAGDVATRSRHALDEAAADRVNSLGEHDRYGAGRSLYRRHSPSAAG